MSGWRVRPIPGLARSPLAVQSPRGVTESAQRAQKRRGEAWVEMMLLAALALLGVVYWVCAELRAAIVVEDSHTMFRPRPTSRVSGPPPPVGGSLPLQRSGRA